MNSDADLALRNLSNGAGARMHPVGQPDGAGGDPTASSMISLRSFTRDRAQRTSARGGLLAPGESFREIRTRLLGLAGAQGFATLVVPVSAGSGGSFVARNLAAAFALNETKSALLIDCDFRQPSQHVALGVDIANGGLLDYLERAGSGELQRIFYETGIPRLRLVAAGHPRAASAEYISSLRMHTLIESLRQAHPDRYLLLDGPPLKGSPDARILANLVDYVVIVAAYARDSAEGINQAVAGLDPKKVAGVVFNCPP